MVIPAAIFCVDWAIKNRFMFIFREGIGFMLGKCHFHRIADGSETATRLVTEALMKAPKLQILVDILPGKTPLYGR